MDNSEDNQIEILQKKFKNWKINWIEMLSSRLDIAEERTS